MADTITLPTTGSGTATPVIATDDVAGVHYEVVKLADGVADGTTRLEFNVHNFDTGAGTDNQTLVGLALPASGGAVAGGTATNPVRIDPTGTTPQPLSTVLPSGNTTLQNAVSATGNGSSLTVTGYGFAILQITGTFSATVFWEGSMDGGTTWTALYGERLSDRRIDTYANQTDVYRVRCGGFDLLRARVTWTSGTSITVVGRASNAPGVEDALGNSGSVSAGLVPSPLYGPYVGAQGYSLDKSAGPPYEHNPSLSVAPGMDEHGRGIPAAGLVAQVDDTGPAAVSENQFGPLRMSSRRALLVEGVASGTAQDVIVSGAALASLQLLDDAVFTDDAAFTPATSKLLMIGAEADETGSDAVDEGDAGALRMTLSRALHANLRNASGTELGTSGAPLRTDPTGTTGQPVTNAGTFAVQADGSVAHDAVNSGNPLYLGAEAIAHGTNPTAVAAADRTKLYANRAGIPFVIGGHPNVQTIEVATTGAQTDVAIITVSTGTKIVVTQAQVVTDNANTAFPQIRVGFGTANTPTTTGVVLSHSGLPAGGGTSRGDGSGIIGVGADNEDLRYTCGAPTGGSLRVLISYYTIES